MISGEASGGKALSVFTVAFEHVVTPISHLGGWKQGGRFYFTFAVGGC